MAGRRQTIYRVLARHRATGEPAGQSMLCVNEFAPAAAFQEDTSVVRAHRGSPAGTADEGRDAPLGGPSGPRSARSTPGTTPPTTT